jgi:iron complex transport system permease protein
MWAGAGVVLIALAIAGVAVGTVPLALDAVWRALHGVGDAATVAIVRDLRLPRVVLAALVGSGLAMSGAALQGALRNPLAEPYLLGVSGGAAVGAVAAIAFGGAFAVLPLAALGGAMLAVVCVLTIARASGGRSDPRIILMAGVVVGAFANAAIMVALAGAPPNELRSALWWMMGSVAGAGWPVVRWLALYVAVGGALLTYVAHEIDALSLGEESAAGLGVDVERANQRVFVLAALLAAATVAAAGLVGFVGLIVPHVARAMGTRGHRALVLASALLGATLLIAADLLARTARRPAELPLGAITALLGVPFFLLQLRKAR